MKPFLTGGNLTILGAKINVPTLEGTTNVKVPPGTSSGQKLRLKEKGVRTPKVTGDQYILVKVIVPKAVDDDSKELIEKFAEKNREDPRADLFK